MDDPVVKQLSAVNAHCITFANEKGGTGKSTLALHLLVSLQRQGRRVAAVDLDFRQRTLSRYLENRAMHQPQLATVEVVVPAVSELDSRSAASGAEIALLGDTLAQLAESHELIIIDSPGSDSPRSQYAMAVANTLVTPLNDSLIDLDLLGRVVPGEQRIDRLSFFADAVWQARQRRALAKLPALDWVLARNRLTMLDARNKRLVNDALEELQGRVACRYISGLSERVIYRELFASGLTLLDLADAIAPIRLTSSHLAARQELRDFIDDLQLPR